MAGKSVNGGHVTMGECVEIRERYERGHFTAMIAADMGYHRDTILFHAKGRCSHRH